MKLKDFKFEIKEIDVQGSGTFLGMASVYGNKDLGGDIVEPGAFTKTISDKNGEVPILWQHDSREPIGMGKLTDSADGLMIEGELALDSSPVAQKARGLMKKGILKGLSIGYDTVRDEVKNGVRYLKELKLWEVSIVTFPMNELATIQSVKNAAEDELFDLIVSEAMKSNREKVLALLRKHAAHGAPESEAAATLEKDAPEILHPSLDRITKLLGES